MKTQIYHNTTKLSGRELRLAIARAKFQKDKIMTFFENNKGERFTPYEVHMAVFDETTPVTSTRRAMTGLTDDGRLTMSNTANRPGIYGAPNHTWKFRK